MDNTKKQVFTSFDVKAYISDKEIANLLEIKLFRTYKFSNTKRRVDKVIAELTKRIENSYNKQIKDMKIEIINQINNI